ncbi:hypothetical protein ACQPZF_24905 [Actinosynnema sp. CS-041913]|uniref:hypothetical protein n=1 Tax=Actinosynnema sp. CS-041913 TaxID=3239917 RepID=UPI003D906EBE
MATVVSRVALGVCAVLAIVGGALLTLMVVLYFTADEYVPALNEIGGWGILAGMCGLAIYVAGVIRANIALRVGAGLGLAGVAFVVSMIIAVVVSLAGDRGGERGTLEDGTAGFVWLLAGVFFARTAAAGRWPVVRKREHSA